MQYVFVGKASFLKAAGLYCSIFIIFCVDASPACGRIRRFSVMDLCVQPTFSNVGSIFWGATAGTFCSALSLCKCVRSQPAPPCGGRGGGCARLSSSTSGAGKCAASKADPTVNAHDEPLSEVMLGSWDLQRCVLLRRVHVNTHAHVCVYAAVCHFIFSIRHRAGGNSYACGVLAACAQ